MEPKEINGLVSASFKMPDAGLLWNSLKDEDEMQTHVKLKGTTEGRRRDAVENSILHNTRSAQ